VEANVDVKVETRKKWRWGINRWWVLLFIILNIATVYAFKPLSPHIQVAPEKLSAEPLFTLPVIGDFYLTNTIMASFIVMILLIVLAYSVKRILSKSSLEPRGIAGALEMLVEYLYNMTESSAGKWAATIFPYFGTIVLMVLVSNWLGLIPGVESIGWLEHSEKGYPIISVIPNFLSAIVQGKAAAGESGYVVVPFVRSASTDLNFTVALALISVLMTQVVGFRAQGIRYLTKFFNILNIFKKPFFGFMDFLVGFLELISEFSKILSFAFRLFGNMFAGAVLLFVVGTMIPYFVPSMLMMFEFFIGMIQAVVFGMLTMVFMAMATQGHGEHES
jgi:F-type H+-transporting ATPase subunit a